MNKILLQTAPPARLTAGRKVGEDFLLNNDKINRELYTRIEWKRKNTQKITTYL